MSKTMREALQQRRSFYAIDGSSSLSEAQLQEMLDFALMKVPSAFNSQSTRLVLLLGEQHAKFWNIVMETLRKMVPAERFASTETKIRAFAAGHGTILFYEDQKVVEGLQAAFPAYADRFPTWSEHTSAMHQLTLWTLLEEAGMGASLQHYNPIIDEQVRETWSLDAKWKLIAQMPFGGIVEHPAPKEMSPAESRRKVFR